LLGDPLVPGRKTFQRSLPKKIDERLGTGVRAGKTHGLYVEQGRKSPPQGRASIDIQ
jgi:hypothetical protein